MPFLVILLTLSQPIDCPTVRAKVAEYGKARALAWALEQGYGWREIRQAAKCLREK